MKKKSENKKDKTFYYPGVRQPHCSFDPGIFELFGSYYLSSKSFKLFKFYIFEY